MSASGSAASINGRKPTIDPADTAMLLIDHQGGLFQIVKDIDVPQLRATALAKVAALLKVPIITTASVPHAQYVARCGEINAWDNPEFHAVVKATGKKKLVIAGLWTEVCLSFAVLSTLAEGDEVYIVTDAADGGHVWVKSFAKSETSIRFLPSYFCHAITLGSFPEDEINQGSDRESGYEQQPPRKTLKKTYRAGEIASSHELSG